MLAPTAAAEGDGELAERHAREAIAIVEAIGGQTATEFTAMPAVLAEARRPGSIGHALALTFDAQLARQEAVRIARDRRLL